MCWRHCNRSPSGRWCCARCRCAAPRCEITGYVDLVSERAYRYRPGQASDLIPLPDGFWDQEGATRTGLIEKLADFDDALLEQLLEEVQPPKEEIYKHLTRTFRGAQIVPVFLGSAAAGLRHAAAVEGAAPRGAGAAGDRGAARHRRRGRAAWRRSSRPITCRIPASCRWRASGAARSPKAMVLNGSRVAGVVAPARRSAGEGAGRPGGRGRRADPHGGDRDRHGADPVRQGRRRCRSRSSRSRSTASRSMPRSAATTSS